LWHCNADSPRIGIPMLRPALRLLVLTLFLAAGSAVRAQGFYPPTGDSGYLPPAGAGGGGGYVPPVGIDTRVGDLRGYFAQAFGNAPAPVGPAITYTAGIDVSETYDTDAVNSDKGTHDFVTQITPMFGVTADTARITGSLFFSPSLMIFAIHGNQNHIAQNLNAAASAIIIPDWFYVDVRGYVADQAISSGYGPGSAATLSRSNSVLTTSYSVAPTLRHQFGGTAVVELGASLSYSTYGGYGSGTNNTAQQLGLNQTSITEEEHALIATGSDFGRFNNALSADGSQSTGSGTLTTSHDNTIRDTVTFALSPDLSVNGSIGHENVQYSGSGYNVNDTIWSFGGHWAPNPDSSIDASYGHNQGQSSFFLSANYRAAPNTVVFASYNQSVGTNVSNLQRGVLNSTVGPNGVTTINGVPVFLNNNFAGVQPGLFRTTTASISGAVTHPRDLYTVTISHQDNSQISNGIAGSSVNNSTISTFGTATWGHDLAPDMHSNVLAEYGFNSGAGVNNQGFGNNQGSYTLSASLSYSISETLSVSGSFTQTNAPSGINARVGSREIAVVSLHKTIY
jgi:uncharacterized protein (PEP-CTERM system associated)